MVGDSSREFGAYATGRSQYRGEFVYHAIPGMLVAAGAGEMRIRVDWDYGSNPAGLDEIPISITYRAANIFPYTPRAEYQWPVPELVDQGDGYKEYVIKLEKSMADAFYQSQSNWAWMVNNEGEETESASINSCGNCGVQEIGRAHV